MKNFKTLKLWRFRLSFKAYIVNGKQTPALKKASAARATAAALKKSGKSSIPLSESLLYEVKDTSYDY